MATSATFLKLGCRAPLSAVILAISAAFLLLTACGDVEDTTPFSTTDAGYDIGSDVSSDAGSDANVDATTDVETEFTYSELCAECEIMGLECPPEARVTSWRQEKAATTVGEAADELCVEPTPGPCDGFEWIVDQLWQCDGYELEFTLQEVGDLCHVVFFDGSHLPFREDGEGFVIYDELTGQTGWVCTTPP